MQDDSFEEYPLLKLMAAGYEMHEFFKSAAGKAVLSRAQEEMDTVLQQFLSKDFYSLQEVLSLKAKAASIRCAVIWLNEIINEADNAQLTADFDANSEV